MNPDPTIGRIVHYTTPKGKVAAIIVGLNADKTINLQVFHNSSHITWEKGVKQGTSKHEWSWPEIKKEEPSPKPSTEPKKEV